MEKLASLMRSYPKFNGHAIDPRYCPEFKRQNYLREWGIWLREHRGDWLPWHYDLINSMKKVDKR